MTTDPMAEANPYPEADLPGLAERWEHYGPDDAVNRLLATIAARDAELAEATKQRDHLSIRVGELGAECAEKEARIAELESYDGDPFITEHRLRVDAQRRVAELESACRETLAVLEDCSGGGYLPDGTQRREWAAQRLRDAITPAAPREDDPQDGRRYDPVRDNATFDAKPVADPAHIDTATGKRTELGARWCATCGGDGWYTDLASGARVRCPACSGSNAK